MLTFQLNANEWNYWFDFAVDHGVQVFALEAIKGRILINASNCVDEVLTLSLMKEPASLILFNRILDIASKNNLGICS